MTNDSTSRIIATCMLILTIIAIAVALYWLRPVMIPFILALFFSLILTPLIDFQMGYFKIPRALAITGTFILGICILILLWVIFSASTSQMLANINTYQSKFVQLLEKTVATLHLENYGMDADSLVKPLLKNLSDSLGSMVLTTVNSIIGLLSKGFIVLIFLLFILMGQRKTKPPQNEAWIEGERQIKRYIQKKVFISALTGLLVGGILMLLGIDMAIVFGLFAFILNFIPSIGSIISTLLPLPVILVSPSVSPLVAILAIAIPGALQFTIGNVIEPKIMGESLDLHPITILMALIFWGMIWGIVGMLLAVPLTAIMKIVFSKIEMTKSTAELFSGRIT